MSVDDIWSLAICVFMYDCVWMLLSTVIIRSIYGYCLLLVLGTTLAYTGFELDGEVITHVIIWTILLSFKVFTISSSLIINKKVYGKFYIRGVK